MTKYGVHNKGCVFFEGRMVALRMMTSLATSLFIVFRGQEIRNLPLANIVEVEVTGTSSSRLANRLNRVVTS